MTRTKIALFAVLTIALSMVTTNYAFAELKQQKIDKLGSDAEKLYLQIKDTADARTKSNLNKQLDVLVAQLEEFGIPTVEKYEADRNYWAIKSSQDQKVVNAPISNFILPLAEATGSPQFQVGYAHDCFTYFVCHEWNGSWVTIPQGFSSSQIKTVVSNHAWLEAKWQVRGTDMIVDHNYVYKLKNGSTVKQSSTGSHHSLNINGQTIDVVTMSRYNNPVAGWTVNAQWAVTSVI